MMTQNLRIAIIHDWLVTYAGAERVLEQILECFPEADLFCVINYLKNGESEFLKKHTVNTSFIQKLPFSKSK